MRDDFLHIDFMRVDPSQEVQRRIPIRFSGRAAGVQAGGKLKTFRRDARIASKPGEVPVELVIDVTPLEENQYLRFRDVSLPNARILEAPDQALAFVEPAKAKTEETAGEGAEAAAG